MQFNIATKVSVCTQQPNVNWVNALENHEAPYPEDDILIQKCSSMTSSVIKDVIKHERENSKLAKFRNSLPPMLKNDQITVV